MQPARENMSGPASRESSNRGIADSFGQRRRSVKKLVRGASTKWPVEVAQIPQPAWGPGFGRGGATESRSKTGPKGPRWQRLNHHGTKHTTESQEKASGGQYWTSLVSLPSSWCSSCRGGPPFRVIEVMRFERLIGPRSTTSLRIRAHPRSSAARSVVVSPNAAADLRGGARIGEKEHRRVGHPQL